jgi:hypothetical protein
MRVRAELLRLEGTRERVPAALHVVDVDLQRQQYRCVVQLCGVQPDDVVEWTVRYRWKALWHSLREAGRSTGRVHMNSRSRPLIHSAAVELVHDAGVFPDLTAEPDEDAGGVVEHGRTQDGLRLLRWSKTDQPREMVFTITAPSRV